MPQHFIGLDFETSGTDHLRSAPIQIGLATRSRCVGSYIGGWRWQGDTVYQADAYIWSEDAFEIHGIPQSKLIDAPTARNADDVISDWLTTTYPGHAKTRIAVGWNVASFDVPFLRSHLPKTARAMSYRTVDLNALVFGITEAGVKRPTGEAWTYNSLKRFVKDRAAEQMVEDEWIAGGPKWHDAEYDALASIYAYEELKTVLRGTA